MGTCSQYGIVRQCSVEGNTLSLVSVHFVIFGCLVGDSFVFQFGHILLYQYDNLVNKLQEHYGVDAFTSRGLAVALVFFCCWNGLFIEILSHLIC